MLYRIVSDIPSEFWPVSEAKARKLVDLRMPPMLGDKTTILLLPDDTCSYRHGNVDRWIIERLTERFLAVYDIHGNHYGYGGTDRETCEPPALLANYHFGKPTAATLWADFQRGNPLAGEVCRDGMNDFRQIRGITPEKVKTRHRGHVAFLEAHISLAGS